MGVSNVQYWPVLASTGQLIGRHGRQYTGPVLAQYWCIYWCIGMGPGVVGVVQQPGQYWGLLALRGRCPPLPRSNCQYWPVLASTGIAGFHISLLQRAIVPMNLLPHGDIWGDGMYQHERLGYTCCGRTCPCPWSMGMMNAHSGVMRARMLNCCCRALLHVRVRFG